MQHATRRVHLIAVALIVCGISASFAATLPPAASSQPVTEMMHGVSVTDPYRNLENVKSPATQAWLRMVISQKSR